MGIQGNRRAKWLSWTGLMVMLGGCGDTHPTEAPVPPLLQPGITCTAWVAEASLDCASTPSQTDVRRSIAVGMQGDRIRLVLSGTRFDRQTRIFETLVALENLLGQPMGTADGTTAAGSRVFFHSGPVVTVGGGEVEVANADGVATFSAQHAAYFDYGGMIPPGGRSAARPWRFRVSRDVESFEFQVYVETRLPFEHGVLRWVRRPVTGGPVVRIWGWGGHELLGLAVTTSGYPDSRIVGSNNAGSAWWSFDGYAAILTDVWGPDDRTAYATGRSNHAHGPLLRSPEGNWREWFDVPGIPRTVDLEAIWGSGAHDVYAVGSILEGTVRRPLILHSTDGERWEQTVPEAAGGRLLTAVWGSGPADVYVLATGTDQSVVLRSTDGGRTWSGRPAPAGLGAVWGLDPGHVWMVGSRGGADPAGLVLYSTDGGTSWTQTSFPGVSLTAVWAHSPREVYVVGAHTADGSAAILRYDGRAWTPMSIPHASGLTDVWGVSADTVIVVGGAVFQGLP